MGGSAFRPALTVVFAAAVVSVFVWAWQSQLLAPQSPAATAFDTSRATAMLREMLKERVPHPVGSDANKTIRDRIAAEFRSAGYEPEIQPAFVCRRSSGEVSVNSLCAKLENIVAVLRGTGDGDAVLATAHYDSVPAGPGAGDDIAGTVALIELARHLKTLPQPKNDVIFLISDAEEIGLLGAQAFAEQNPRYKNVRVVVNLEARGAIGPSTMFETGPGNYRLMTLFQSAVPRPVADSVAYEIYKTLGNDTDFSVYRKDALTGFNFAFTGAASRYHTPADNPDLLDPKSLQHHGDHIFGLVPVLANAELDALKAGEDASYFDVFGQILVAWPSAWNLPASILGLGLVFVLMFLHRDAFSVLSTAWGVFVVMAVPLALFGIGWALAYPLGVWPAAHPLDHASPLAGNLALSIGLLLAPMLVALLAASPAERFRPEPRLVALIAWLSAAAAAIGVSIYLPGATHAFLGPVLAFGAIGVLETLVRPGRLFVAAILAGFVTAAFFWMSYFTSLQAVFGFANSESRLAAMAIFGLATAPVFFVGFNGAKALPVVGLAVLGLLGATAFGAVSAPYSPEHPRGTSIAYAQTPDGKAHWLLMGWGPFDPDYTKTRGFQAGDGGLGGALARGRTAQKAAETLKLPGPVWTETARRDDGDATIVTGALTAARDGLFLRLYAPKDSGVFSLTVNGTETLVRDLGEGRALAARMYGFRSEPIAVELRFKKGRAAHFTIAEQSGLPDVDAARTLAAARGPSTLPTDDGDRAIVVTRVDIESPPAPAASATP